MVKVMIFGFADSYIIYILDCLNTYHINHTIKMVYIKKM
jgi:hypothetical protein